MGRRVRDTKPRIITMRAAMIVKTGRRTENSERFIACLLVFYFASNACHREPVVVETLVLSLVG